MESAKCQGQGIIEHRNIAIVSELIETKNFSGDAAKESTLKIPKSALSGVLCCSFCTVSVTAVMLLLEYTGTVRV